MLEYPYSLYWEHEVENIFSYINKYVEDMVGNRRHNGRTIFCVTRGRDSYSY